VTRFEEIAENLPGILKTERYPTLRGRITAIAATPVSKAKIAQGVRWAVRGDRFLSYAAEMPPGTNIVAGEWWPDDYVGGPLVSITADIAKGFGVVVGDTLTVNILGREVTARISSLREVDWSTLNLNFAIIFSPGVLEKAPQTHIATIQVPPEQEEAAFRAITGEFPNVSAISTREMLKNVSRVLDRIGTAFRSMAAIALLTGVLVLAGAVSADQHRRIHDAVIFKVCGATRLNILGAFAAEFLLLGLIAGCISAVVGSLAAMGILKGLMQMSFTLHPTTIITTILTGIALTLTLGLLGTWKALGQKPAIYLRGE
jgi:putative ABC transport system permease protein